MWAPPDASRQEFPLLNHQVAVPVFPRSPARTDQSAQNRSNQLPRFMLCVGLSLISGHTSAPKNARRFLLTGGDLRHSLEPRGLKFLQKQAD